MTADEIISFARAQLRAAGQPDSWESVARFVASLHSFHLRGYRLQDQALAKFLNGSRPVSGSERVRDID